MLCRLHTNRFKWKLFSRVWNKNCLFLLCFIVVLQWFILFCFGIFSILPETSDKLQTMNSNLFHPCLVTIYSQDDMPTNKRLKNPAKWILYSQSEMYRSKILNKMLEINGYNLTVQYTNAFHNGKHTHSTQSVENDLDGRQICRF